METNFELTPGKYLLPRFCLFIGLLCILVGLTVVIVRFGIGYKPEFLNMKVFAMTSTYFSTNYFHTISNNVSEEISGLMLVVGFLLVSLAREQTETLATVQCRYKSMILAIYINSILLLLSFLFIYGLGFIAILSFNLISILLFYNLLFRYFLFQERNRETTEDF